MMIFIQLTLISYTAQKMKCSFMDFFSKCDQDTADLVTFTEDIFMENFIFFVVLFEKIKNSISTE